MIVDSKRQTKELEGKDHHASLLISRRSKMHGMRSQSIFSKNDASIFDSSDSPGHGPFWASRWRENLNSNESDGRAACNAAAKE
jgi:hypothetical protein